MVTVSQKEIDATFALAKKLGVSVSQLSRPQICAAFKVEDRRARSIREAAMRTIGETPSKSSHSSIPDRHDNRIRMENADLRKQLNDALRREVLEEDYQKFVAEVARHRVEHPPNWAVTPRSGKSHQAVPVAHLSDAHFDEEVNPAEINWVNAYNRPIAEMRLRRFGEKVIVLCDEYLKGVQYPGIVVPVSGDMFSGNIHDELRETNFDQLCGSFRYWIDPMYAMVKMLADRFGKVFVPWVVGNHPRGTKKPRMKGRVRDNFDWLLGAMLQRDFARDGDKRVQFLISESADCNFSVYATRYHQTHGDSFRGGSGIAAELSPMMIGDARRRERQQATKTPYDIMIMGHWHRRICLPSIKCNGSLKGYDEYASINSFKFQPPMQSLWLDTPERGITFEAPIHVASDDEGWEQKNSRTEFFKTA